MNKDHKDPHELDLTKPRLASYKQKKWKRHQDTVYWVDVQLAQRRGVKFCQQGRTQSSCTTHSQLIVSRKRLWWNLKKSYTRKRMCHFDHHRRFPTKIIGRAIWSSGRLVTRWREETLERTKFDRDTLNQEKHDKVTDPTSTENPVSRHESTKRCVLTPRLVENDQTGTGKPVTVEGT